MSKPIDDAERLARAILLFHSGVPWDSAMHEEWRGLGMGIAVTTRALGDLARAVIAERAPAATGAASVAAPDERGLDVPAFLRRPIAP